MVENRSTPETRKHFLSFDGKHLKGRLFCYCGFKDIVIALSFKEGERYKMKHGSDLFFTKQPEQEPPT